MNFFRGRPRRFRAEHGTFSDVERQLPEIAAMGFDIVYLPPIHPIGRAFRKGPNNATVAPPGAPGSPWAIGDRGCSALRAVRRRGCRRLRRA